MIKKLLILLFFCVSIICRSDIDIRMDQPKVNIRLFKTDDIKENLDEFPISNDVRTDFKEIIEYYSEAEKFNNANIILPKIILLYGDNKNGDKWRLSRVIAKDLKFSIIRIFPYELLEANIPLNYILKQLEEAGPCIVFIDKFDEFVRKSIFESKFSFQVNSIIDVLKKLPILLVLSVDKTDNTRIKELFGQPGIVKEIMLTYPDLQSREKILISLTKELKLSSDVDIKKIAMLTYGFTVYNLFELINETKAISFKKGKDLIHFEDFDLALSKLKYGKIKENKREEERKITAYHEAGHTLAKILLLKDLDPFYKVTIISRTAYSGITCYFNEEKSLRSREEVFNSVQIILAGTVAERIIFNDSFVGSESDLKKATEVGMHMVCHLGMSDNLVPMFYDKKDKNVKNEIQDIIKKAYDSVYKLLSKNKDKLEKIAKLLIEKETVYASELHDLLELHSNRALQ